jgi:beta-lactamase superfamily II metal-dependent hydrolase
VSLEIDMLEVSDGDAIVVRYVDPHTRNEWVGVIDGGRTEEDGRKVVRHVRRYTRRKEIDDLISTHPDADHIGGLPTIVSSLVVRRAWIHDPGRHIDFSNLVRRLRHQPYHHAAQKVYRSLEQCSYLLNLLDRRGIPRSEPFADTSAGYFQILGPTRPYYEKLLQDFEDLDGIFVEDEREEHLSEEDEERESTVDPDSVINDDNTTSAENNSSVICRIFFDNDEYLFTGDAGVDALERAIEAYDVSDVHWLDAPHHGSKHNVCSTLLDTLHPNVTYFSARGTRKHPSQAVINALKRRHCQCYSTHYHSSLCHRRDAPQREGWTTADPL